MIQNNQASRLNTVLHYEIIGGFLNASFRSDLETESTVFEYLNIVCVCVYTHTSEASELKSDDTILQSKSNTKSARPK